MRIRTFVFVAVLVSLETVALAHGRPSHFAGAHPISAKHGGGYCYIESPHIHAYAPDHAPLYQQVDDHYVFTGDPTPFGYDGEKHLYYGHHPVVAVNGTPVYCYLDGPHSHATPPSEDGNWKVKKGVAFYVGPFAPNYGQLKPMRVRAVNAEYRPYAAYRPTVQVEPPDGYTGDVYMTPPAVEVNAPSPSLTVTAPSAAVVVNAPPPPRVVVAPAPSVTVTAPPPPSIVVNAPPPPRVVVTPPSPHVVVAPAPGRVVVGAPGPRVVVGAPAPHVVIGAPAPRVVVAPSPGRVVVGGPAPGVVVVKGKGHHNHGKHKGWYK